LAEATDVAQARADAEPAHLKAAVGLEVASTRRPPCRQAPRSSRSGVAWSEEDDGRSGIGGLSRALVSRRPGAVLDLLCSLARAQPQGVVFHLEFEPDGTLTEQRFQLIVGVH
jgi:hypothetical protein